MGRWARAVGAAVGLATLAAGGGPLAFETLAGEPTNVSLATEDRALLVHFWATWCPECVDELPLLAAATPRCAARGVRIVTVSVGESREAVVDYLAAHALALEPLRDPKGRAWRAIGGVGLPTNFTWTRDERRIEAGPRDAAGWRVALAELGCRSDADGAGD